VIPAGVDLPVLAGADVVFVLVLFGQGHAGELALATTDHGPQEIGILLVVAAGERAVVRELLGHQIKLLLADDGRYLCHGNPFFRWKENCAVVGTSNRLEGPAAYPGRTG
jgi:hypothetical protein